MNRMFVSKTLNMTGPSGEVFDHTTREVKVLRRRVYCMKSSFRGSVTKTGTTK